MKMTVFIPSDSTLSEVRILQKQYIAKIYESTKKILLPVFPLWGKLSTITYNPQNIRNRIKNVRILLPQFINHKLVLPLHFSGLNLNNSLLQQNYEIVLAQEDNSDNINSDILKNIICKLNEKNKNISIPSRVFKIGYANMEETEWDLLEFKWIKTAKIKIPY